MPNELDYVSTPIPEDGIFKISPSSFANFIQRPHAWYESEVLENNVFSHNTSSVIGTAVHYCAEKVAKSEEVDTDEIDKYISSFEVTDDYDPELASTCYRDMAETLVNDYVLGAEFLSVEESFCAHIKDSIYAAGTLDCLHGTKEDCMIGDYKSYNSKTKPRAIPQNYKYQLLVYAWILKQNGYNPTRIRLIYVNRNIVGEISEKTGKRMKSYPPEVTVLTETITDEDIDFIHSLLELCVDSLLATEKHPELRHVIWHDPRLK